MNYKNALIYTENFRFERGSFSVKDGKFCDVMGEAKDDALDLGGAKVIPGLIDIHTHGNSGSDFSDGDYDGYVRMARYYASRGVTSFAATTLTVPYEQIEAACACAKKLHTQRPSGAATLRGVHMEGPFFCTAKRGAQNAAHLKAPDFDAFCRINEVSGGLVKLIAIAPELDGAEKFIEKASRICTVSLGHTEADYDTARRAFDAGARELTHLYNAMPGLHHRDPGPIAAGFEDNRVSAELIGDGEHVHPAIIRLAFRMFGAERTVLISDSLRCCGMPDGEYELGGQRTFLQNGVARLADGTLAGSATDLFECMCRVISFGVPECDAIRASTYNPARQIGCLNEVGSIADGKCADFVICDDGLNARQVFVAGKPAGDHNVMLEEVVINEGRGPVEMR